MPTDQEIKESLEEQKRRPMCLRECNKRGIPWRPWEGIVADVKKRSLNIKHAVNPMVGHVPSVNPHHEQRQHNNLAVISDEVK